MEKEEVEVREGGTEHDGQGNGLPPWEQHASVISLPRFDYRTPSLLLECSHSGFLITCPIKREKSATKEAISILEKLCSCASQSMDPESNVATKKRKIEEKDGDGGLSSPKKGLEITNACSGQISEETDASNLQSGEMQAKQSNLSLVKLARSGLILLTFTSDRFISTVDVVSSIFHSLGCGDLKSPLWCHRIFPIQGTCTLKEKDLSIAVTNLFQHYLAKEGAKLEKPIKFAVGYNRRGLDQPVFKEPALLLDRDQCFSVVAKAVKDLAPDAVVDLNSPELVVLVEALPVSGLPPRSAVAGVSILPRSLITAKPRLSVRALIADGNSRKKKS
ncbi:unnamed protein product [Spirodela intermedia]|uniref:THUMP domain-containing protein n=1 Tax=Spirodela intermedia TaxID=51605 RepID=A0A7I8LMV9_SPIIN|nr:unnamed protein product [Spirodela intermedia]